MEKLALIDYQCLLQEGKGLVSESLRRAPGLDAIHGHSVSERAALCSEEKSQYRWGPIRLPMLVSDSWAQVILLPGTPKELGLQEYMDPLAGQESPARCAGPDKFQLPIAQTDSCSVTQAGVQWFWHDFGSLQPLLASSSYFASASQVVPKTGFHHVGHAGLELLTSGDPPSLASQSAGMTGVSHHSPPPTPPCRSQCDAPLPEVEKEDALLLPVGNGATIMTLKPQVLPRAKPYKHTAHQSPSQSLLSGQLLQRQSMENVPGAVLGTDAAQ
ncbi:hypothetical protein AAY473_020153, partial [Plecturocebus cupreus]